MDARTQPLQASIVTPEQALIIKPFGLNMKVLLTTEATGGAISVIMAWHKPGEGPPNHVHFSQDEIFFVVEGICELAVSDQTSTVGPSSIVFIPRNTVHRFKNIGDMTGCMLDWTLPADRTTTSRRSPNLAPLMASPARRRWRSAGRTTRTSQRHIEQHYVQRQRNL